MAAFAARRPTRDIDLAATRITNEIADVEDRVRAILAAEVDDGVSASTWRRLQVSRFASTPATPASASGSLHVWLMQESRCTST